MADGQVLRPEASHLGLPVTRLDYILRKEVIQPQVPLRLPCYDLVPIRSFAFGTYLVK